MLTGQQAILSRMYLESCMRSLHGMADKDIDITRLSQDSGSYTLPAVRLVSLPNTAKYRDIQIE